MTFNLNEAITLLSRTPKVLDALLSELPDEWVTNNEGDETWSPFDIVGHLIQGEKTDWIIRAKMILNGVKTSFTPFDRFAQFENCKDKSLSQLLNEFKVLRESNLQHLKSLQITEAHLNMLGIHPEFGQVSLKQLLSTWVVHDLGHINQIARVMAKQYQTEMGPWINYFNLLKKEI